MKFVLKTKRRSEFAFEASLNVKAKKAIFGETAGRRWI